MKDLSTKFMGLSLKNPIIAGSSGLSSSLAGIKKLEEGGAGAIVLKSIFEEEIFYEMDDLMKNVPETSRYMERFDYHDLVLKGENLAKYTTLIKEAKQAVKIPIVASINCSYTYEWTDYAKRLESAGADALELNMFFLPTDQKRSAEEVERAYFMVVEKIVATVSIPVSLKISYYFTCLGQTIQKLSRQGIAGLVLFNRFYSPDFDIENLKVTPTNILSSPSDLTMSLRWMAMMSQKVECDLAASTGVHDGAAVIKQLLAGAQAVQVVSTLYKNGPTYIQTMLNELQEWMTRHGYEKLQDFRGKMSQDKSVDPAIYERVQFMKYFSGQKDIL
ncbi:dihydroorotate dehydrogenase (fumarate) [Desulfuromusa kysingii]|uniref:Dihydroorotate dehydrogenase (Fumarate) n=1 Tax=Desulfuromusa kysingii TaxID=37625 RepID=A0A1H4AZX2_9BACT|nr:dihydroorotate dehydrogenase-like protein [Desulfuromusa kysingii]SEA41152.1 dihydroorotate dehydrogenase (fumarate) [Desulfuromusa kysingii]